MSLCHELWFSNPIALQSNGPDLRYFKLWTVRPNNLSFRYLRIRLSGCKYAGMRKSEFVTKTGWLTGIFYNPGFIEILRA